MAEEVPTSRSITEGPSGRRESWILVAALVVVFAVVYGRVIFGGQTFALDSDHLRFVIPARAQLAEALRAGRIPEWWEGVELGVNVAATPYYQSAYPPAWLVAIFGAAYGADLVLLAHLLLGGVGLALWARRLGASPQSSFVGGALFMLGGYMSSMIVMHTAGMSPGWIPWTAWSADRLALAASRDNRRALLREAAVASMCMSMLILSGDPSSAITGGIVGFIVAGARSHWRWRAIAAEGVASVAALIMSAVVLLPLALNLPETDRSRWGDDPSVWLIWGLHPLSLLQLVWPHALGDPVEPTANLARIVADAALGASIDPAWAFSIHFGWVSMGLVVCGAFASVRGTRAFAVGSLVLLVVAMGRYTPVYAWFRALVLPEHWLRYAARHFVAVVVLWSALAAIGLDEALRQARSKRVRLALLVSIGLAAALTLLAAFDGASLLSPLVQHGPEVRPVEAPKVAHAFVSGGISTIAGLVGFGAAMVVVTRDRMDRWAKRLAAASITVPLGIEAATMIPVVSRDAVTNDAGILASLAQDQSPGAPRPRLYRDPSYSWLGSPPPPERVAPLMGRTAAEDLGWLHGFAHVPGYAPAVTRPRWTQVLDAAHKDGALGKMMELFSVDYAAMVVKKQDTLDTTPTGFEPAVRDEADLFAVFRKTLVRPRAFVTSRWVSLDNDEAVIASMFASSFDHGLVRFADDGTTRHPRKAEGTDTAKCEVATPRPERVDLRCALNADGYAVLVDSWSPGWSATVDGEPAPIERADEVLRAVRVGAGSHRISFAFSAPGFQTGGWLSLVTWTIVGLVAGVVGRKHPVSPNTPSDETLSPGPAQKHGPGSRPARSPSGGSQTKRKRTGRNR